MERIDNLDRQILEIISQNARIPFKDVAAECGVSRAAIHQRVQRLIDLGVIVGSGYHVNPKSLGYRTCTYVGIKLEKGSMYKSVVAELQKIPEIVECHFTTGPYTMLTKLYACDNEHLMDLLNNKMQEIPGVVATETLISLEQSIKKEIPIRVESKPMEFLSEYHLAGLFIGICTFLIIGLFHPVVVKAEYYWGTKCWWIFLVLGIAGVAASLSIDNVILSSLLGVFAFSSFWTIKEVFEQEERVTKRLVPQEPERKYKF